MDRLIHSLGKYLWIVGYYVVVLEQVGNCYSSYISPVSVSRLSSTFSCKFIECVKL